jgi:hypothetical protein
MKTPLAIIVLSLSFLASTCAPPRSSSIFQEVEAETVAPFVQKAMAYFSTNHDLDPDRFSSLKVYMGTPEEVTSVCGENAFACNLRHTVLVRDDGILCEMIVHEIGHSAAFFLYGHWDVDHSELAAYYESQVFELCAEDSELLTQTYSQ